MLAPDFRGNDCDGKLPAQGFPFPDFGERATAFEYAEIKLGTGTQNAGGAFFEAGCASKIVGSVPDKTAVSAIQGKACADSKVDREQAHEACSQQRTVREPSRTSSGACSRHLSMAYGQRGWNRQPVGRS